MTIVQMGEDEERELREFVTEIRNSMAPFKAQEVDVVCHKERFGDDIELYKINARLPRHNLTTSFTVSRDVLIDANKDGLAFMLGQELSRQFRSWHTTPEDNVTLGEN